MQDSAKAKKGFEVISSQKILNGPVCNFSVLKFLDDDDVNEVTDTLVNRLEKLDSTKSI